jgi:FkbH-like protein
MTPRQDNRQVYLALARALLDDVGNADVRRILDRVARLAPLAAMNTALDAEFAGGDAEQLLDAVLRNDLGDVDGWNRREAGDITLAALERLGARLDADTLVAALGTLPYHYATERQRSLVEQALRTSPRHVGLLRRATDLPGPGDVSTLLRYADCDRSPGAARQVVGKLEPFSDGMPSARVACVSTFTIRPLLPYLTIAGHAAGFRVDAHFTEYDGWAREILDPGSELRRFAPEVLLMLLALDDLVSDRDYGIGTTNPHAHTDAVMDRVADAFSAARAWHSGPIVMHTFWTSRRGPTGVIGQRTSASPAGWVADLNVQLAALTESMDGVYLLDTEEVLLHRQSGALDDAKWRHLAGMRLGYDALWELARAQVRFLAPSKGLTRKCVVVDLDNTLWGGVVGEEGLAGIKLGKDSPGSEYVEFQRYLASLADRGILLAVNSKNNLDDVMEVFRDHPEMILTEDSFATMRVNWLPKTGNLVSIAEELNIGLDSLVFVDDNPHERELVRQLLPAVATPELPADPARFRATVELMPGLQTLAVTDADRARPGQYRAKRKRDQVRIAAGSVDDYLRSLDLRLRIARARDTDVPRVHQLFQRTNQFNTTSRRYSLEDVKTFAVSSAHRLWTLHAQDRFGDHGLVGVALVRRGTHDHTVDSFLMSCRVIGYGMETALLARIAADATADSVGRLIGEFRATAKNAPAKELFARHGFEAPDSRGQEWILHAERFATCQTPDWITVSDDDGS